MTVTGKIFPPCTTGVLENIYSSRACFFAAAGPVSPTAPGVGLSVSPGSFARSPAPGNLVGEDLLVSLDTRFSASPGLVCRPGLAFSCLFNAAFAGFFDVFVASPVGAGFVLKGFGAPCVAASLLGGCVFFIIIVIPATDLPELQLKRNTSSATKYLQ